MRFFFTIIFISFSISVFSQAETVVQEDAALLKAKTLITSGKIDKAKKVLIKHFSEANDSSTTVRLTTTFLEKYKPIEKPSKQVKIEEFEVETIEKNNTTIN